MPLSGSAGSRSLHRAFFLHLKRHTSSGLYLAELDGLRFVAIFFVYIYHLSGDVVRHSPANAPAPVSRLYGLTAQLNIGVPLFFAISGMILGLPFARYWLKGGPPVSLKRYFLRRVTRLEPPYIAALLLLFAAKLAGHRATVPEMLPHLGASLIYMHSVIYRELSSINPVAWSLEVEVQFYILAPLLALVFAVRNAWIRRTLIAGAILIAAFWTPWLPDLNVARANPAAWIKHLSLLGNIQYFLAGFLLSDFFLLAPPTMHRRPVWDAISILGWPALLYLLVAAPGLVFWSLPWIILVLYGAVFYGPLSNRSFGSLYLASIGGMCYSIYLLHNYAIASLGFLTERIGGTLPWLTRFAVQIVLMTPVVLLISIVFYLVVEQPCMRPDWPSRLRAYVTGRSRKVALGA